MNISEIFKKASSPIEAINVIINNFKGDKIPLSKDLLKGIAELGEPQVIPEPTQIVKQFSVTLSNSQMQNLANGSYPFDTISAPSHVTILGMTVRGCVSTAFNQNVDFIVNYDGVELSRLTMTTDLFRVFSNPISQDKYIANPNASTAELSFTLSTILSGGEDGIEVVITYVVNKI